MGKKPKKDKEFETLPERFSSEIVWLKTLSGRYESILGEIALDPASTNGWGFWAAWGDVQYEGFSTPFVAAIHAGCLLRDFILELSREREKKEEPADDSKFFFKVLEKIWDPNVLSNTKTHGISIILRLASVSECETLLGILRGKLEDESLDAESILELYDALLEKKDKELSRQEGNKIFAQAQETAEQERRKLAINICRAILLYFGEKCGLELPPEVLAAATAAMTQAGVPFPDKPKESEEKGGGS